MSEIQVFAVKPKREREQFEVLTGDVSIRLMCILNKEFDTPWSEFSFEWRQLEVFCVCDNET